MKEKESKSTAMDNFNCAFKQLINKLTADKNDKKKNDKKTKKQIEQEKSSAIRQFIEYTIAQSAKMKEEEFNFPDSDEPLTDAERLDNLKFMKSFLVGRISAIEDQKKPKKFVLVKSAKIEKKECAVAPIQKCKKFVHVKVADTQKCELKVTRSEKEQWQHETTLLIAGAESAYCWVWNVQKYNILKREISFWVKRYNEHYIDKERAKQYTKKPKSIQRILREIKQSEQY